MYSNLSFSITKNKIAGSIEQVEDEKFGAKPNSIKFTQTYDPEYFGRYHSEVVKHNAARIGLTGYYGWAFKLHETWKFDNVQFTISQFITDFSDWDKCVKHHKKAWSPTTMFFLEQGNILYTRIRTGNICQEQANVKVFPIGPITPGKWHTLVLGVNWQSTGANVQTVHNMNSK